MSSPQVAEEIEKLRQELAALRTEVASLREAGETARMEMESLSQSLHTRIELQRSNMVWLRDGLLQALQDHADL